MPLSRRLWQRPSDVVASFLLLMYDLRNMRLPRFPHIVQFCMFSCFLARAGAAAALERPRVARGRSLPRRFFLCANGRVKARDWIFVCFNSFLFSIRCRSALEADAEESSRMVDVEFISRESWLEVGLQSGARVFFSRGAKSTKWAWVFRQRVSVHA